MTTKFFISYRRSDSAEFAELLYERLVAVFGEDDVFLDREKIDLGDAFEHVIDERVGSCEVLFAVVGPNWLKSTDERGLRRLDSPRDYVRHEIATALKQSKRVIPLLIRGAHMPDAADLPEDLKEFAGRDAQQIRESNTGADLRILIQKITGVWNESDKIPLWERFRRVVVPLELTAVLAMFCAAWMGLADYFNLDTRAESYTMLLGDIINPPVPHAQLAIVGIGETAQTYFKKKFDRTWRREHAHFIRLLSEAGAAVVAFDLLVDEPSAADEELAAAISAARRNGTTVIFGTEHGVAPDSALEAIAETAFLCVGTNLGYARIAPLVVKGSQRLHSLAAAAPVWGSRADEIHKDTQAPGESRLVPSLALAAMLRGGKLDDIDEESHTIFARDGAGRLKRIKFSRYDDFPTAAGCLSLTAADEATQRKVAQLIVRFTPLEQLRSQTDSYETVFAEGTDILSKRFKGKIVLVGREDQNDKVRIFRGLKEEWRYGFEVHADAINTLAHEVGIRSRGMWHQFWIMILMAILGQLPIWCNWSSTGVRRAYLFAIAVAYVALSISAYATHFVLLNTVYHLGAFFSSYWIALKVGRRMRVWNMRER